MRRLLPLALLLCALPLWAQCNSPVPYACARTDLTIVQLPTPPNVGNLTGANTVVTDPDFHSQIVRATDSSTRSANQFIDNTSGGPSNPFNTDSTLVWMATNNGVEFPFTFDANNTLAVNRLYAAADFKVAGDVNMSWVNKNLAYAWSDAAPQIVSYDLTDRVNAPSSVLVYDFTTSSNCLGSGFGAPTWVDRAGVALADKAFAAEYSVTGAQGTGVHVVVYKPGSGCSYLNTQTGNVKGDFGSTGTVTIGDRFTLHAGKISKDGNWMILTSTTCLSTCTAAGNQYFWQIGTTNLVACMTQCSGHPDHGSLYFFTNPDVGLFVKRLYGTNSPITTLTTKPPGITAPMDQHGGMNNTNATDTNPVLAIFNSTTTPYPSAWYNEITAFSPNGDGTVWRFAHHFSSLQSLIFDTSIASGQISQDGRFAMWASDWMGTLGNTDGVTSTCTLGTNCRGDVFIVKLGLSATAATTIQGVTISGTVIK